MPTSPDLFAQLLTRAVYQIKTLENKNLQLIHDELGFVLGRDGGSFINYLRKGHVPTDLSDTEALVRELVRRRGLDHAGCSQLLASGGYPGAERLTAELFTPSKPAAGISSRAHADSTDAGANLPNTDLPDSKVFITGPPITEPRHFFGRERELRRIFRHWRRPPMEHVTIVGARRSGKTSLLHYLRQITAAAPEILRPQQKQDWLPATTAYQWIWVDFQDPRMRNQELLLRHLLIQFGELTPPTCTLDLFMERLTNRSWDQPVIVLMDEVGIGISTAEVTRDFWDGLRALVMSNVTNGNLGFMLAAHGSLVQLAEDRGKASPFWNMFVTEELGPLTEAEAHQLIASSPIPFATNDVRWIIEQSKCWPCLLQFLCRECLAALTGEEPVAGWRQEGLRQIMPFAHLLEHAD